MSYKYITIFERSCIYQFLNLRMSIRQIAKAIKRYPSTITREIKRNKTVYCKIKLATYRKKHLKEVKYSQTKN